MRIAIFDNFVTRNNPAGSCHRQLLEALCEAHEFTVFATAFDNPRPDRIRFIRVPAIHRPQFLLFVSYQIVSRLMFAWHTRIRGLRFDLLQSVESKGPAADVIYQHFCHAHHLAHSRPAWTLRAAAYRINHWMHALLEGRCLRGARRIVAPSQGLADDIGSTWGQRLLEKTVVIPNPVDTRYFHPCDSGTRAHQRRQLQIDPDALTLVFAALGNFEHKGLPLLLDVIRSIDDPHLRMLVVGGNEGLIREYRQRCSALGLQDGQVTFVGRVADVRPYYWAADVFCLPSRYESFSLVAHEAAACGLPVMATPLHGVSNLVDPGRSGWLLPAEPEQWCREIRQCLTDRSGLARMGQEAAVRASMLGREHFARAWSLLYSGLEHHP